MGSRARLFLFIARAAVRLYHFATWLASVAHGVEHAQATDARCMELEQSMRELLPLARSRAEDMADEAKDQARADANVHPDVLGESILLAHRASLTVERAESLLGPSAENEEG